MKHLLIAIALTFCLCGVGWAETGVLSEQDIKDADELAKEVVRTLCFKHRHKKSCYWQYKSFDLCEGRKYERYGSGVTGYISPYPTCKRCRTTVLNELLRKGWQLQDIYRGEEVVYLRKQVCP